MIGWIDNSLKTWGSEVNLSEERLKRMAWPSKSIIVAIRDFELCGSKGIYHWSWRGRKGNSKARPRVPPASNNVSFRIPIEAMSPDALWMQRAMQGMDYKLYRCVFARYAVWWISTGQKVSRLGVSRRTFEHRIDNAHYFIAGRDLALRSESRRISA